MSNTSRLVSEYYDPPRILTAPGLEPPSSGRPAWQWALASLTLAGGTLLLRRALFGEHMAATVPVFSEEEGQAKLVRRFGIYGERDSIDQASWESFPASDPPAW